MQYWYSPTNIESSLEDKLEKAGIKGISRDKLDENIQNVFREKERIYNRYKKNLQNIKGINIPKVRDWATRYIMWVFNIYLDDNFLIKRDELTKRLKDKNIDTRDAFVPINMQQVLIDKYKLFNKDDCPNANYIMKNGFYLPSGAASA